jgi:hypothetical protein
MVNLKMKCACCQQAPKEDELHDGVLIQGWLSKFTAKFTQEGEPVVLFVCKACIDKKVITLLQWTANRYPIRVREAGGGLVIEAPERDLEPAVAGPPAAAAGNSSPAECRPSTGQAPAQPAAAQSLAEPQVPRGEERKTPPPPRSPPIGPVQKPGVTAPGGACAKCQKAITNTEANKSLFIHGVPLCKECDAVETARVIGIMRANEAAGKPLTEGLGGTVKAVAFCQDCGGIVNENERKASRLFFSKTLCKACFNATKAKQGVTT